MLFIRWHSLITLHGFLKQAVRKLNKLYFKVNWGRCYLKKKHRVWYLRANVYIYICCRFKFTFEIRKFTRNLLD
jgi:hypothetical protein